MYHYKNKIIALFAAGMLLGACSGGGSTTDGGTSTTRAVTGDLSGSGTGALVKGAVSDDCGADEVMAVNTEGTATTAAVAADCTFTISLEAGASYVINFLADGSFVASLIFDNGIEGFTTASLPLSGEGGLDLGIITINGTVAIPENEPYDDFDHDGDGVADRFDDDDDNDGTSDEMEDDCDLDGSIDDYDDDDASCEGSDDGTARVVEVKPRNDPHTDLGEDLVDLDKEVKARLTCTVDQDTVTSETFSVASEDGSDILDCSYEFSGSGSSGNRITCKHEGRDFLPNTVYVATISGVTCEGGEAVADASWSWATEAEDDEDGDIEDDLDDEDEAEGEDIEDDDSGDDTSDDDSEDDDSGDDSEDD